MYSILLKVTTSSSDRWKYLYNDDGSLYQDDDLDRVRQKVIELLSDHVLSAIKVVANKRAVSHIIIEGNPDEPGQWLPEVTIDDNGKVLMVINGEWDKGEIEVGDVLPDVTVDDNGKVLKVVEGEWAPAEEDGGTDENVLQVPTNAENGAYELLFSNSANNTEETGAVRKSVNLKYNPDSKRIIIDGSNNGTTEITGGHVTIKRNIEGMAPIIDMVDQKADKELIIGSSAIEFRNDYATPTKTMSLINGNIILNGDTWDGTNVDLKTALTAAGGGAGTTVVANPSDTATDDLTKLQIGSTVYDIPGNNTDTTYALHNDVVPTSAYSSLILKDSNNQETYGYIYKSTVFTDTYTDPTTFVEEKMPSPHSTFGMGYPHQFYHYSKTDDKILMPSNFAKDYSRVIGKVNDDTVNMTYNADEDSFGLGFTLAWDPSKINLESINWQDNNTDLTKTKKICYIQGNAEFSSNHKYLVIYKDLTDSKYYLRIYSLHGNSYSESNKYELPATKTNIKIYLRYDTFPTWDGGSTLCSINNTTIWSDESSVSGYMGKSAELGLFKDVEFINYTIKVIEQSYSSLYDLYPVKAKNSSGNNIDYFFKVLQDSTSAEYMSITQTTFSNNKLIIASRPIPEIEIDKAYLQIWRNYWVDWDGVTTAFRKRVEALEDKVAQLEAQLANVNVISNQTIDEICV